MEIFKDIPPSGSAYTFKNVIVFTIAESMKFDKYTGGQLNDTLDLTHFFKRYHVRHIPGTKYKQMRITSPRTELLAIYYDDDPSSADPDLKELQVTMKLIL